MRGTGQDLEVPARRDPGDREGHAVNEQGPAYLRRETRLMEYVERPLLGSGEPVNQDVSLGPGFGRAASRKDLRKETGPSRSVAEWSKSRLVESRCST